MKSYKEIDWSKMSDDEIYKQIQKDAQLQKELKKQNLALSRFQKGATLTAAMLVAILGSKKNKKPPRDELFKQMRAQSDKNYIKRMSRAGR